MSEDATARQRGRPSDYTEVLAARICERLAGGESLRAICEDDDMPAESTVRGWAVDDRGGFYAQYTRARDIGLDNMADHVIDIADTAEDAAKGRLRFDARRWYLSKLAPKRYGERLDLTADLGGVQVVIQQFTPPPTDAT